MPTNESTTSFRILWWTLGIGLLVMSVKTVIAGVAEVHPDLHAILIGSVEAVSALFFLMPATRRAGALGLLVTILVAFVIHAFMRQFRWDLLIYGAGVNFVRGHVMNPERPA